MPALGALEFSRYIIRAGITGRAGAGFTVPGEVPGIVPGSTESGPNGVGVKK